jgi:hypothetical protein
MQLLQMKQHISNAFPPAYCSFLFAACMAAAALMDQDSIISVHIVYNPCHLVSLTSPSHALYVLQAALTGEENPIVEAVEPAAELAAAILKQLAPAAAANIAAATRASEAAAALSAVTSSFTANAASSSGAATGSSSSSKLSTALLDAVSAAICTADVLAFRMFQECAQEGPPVEPAEERSRTLLTSNKELQTLLLAHLAYVTQEMHNSMRGKTAVSAAAMLQPKAAKQQQRQQQQRLVLGDVEPHHKKLLQLLLGVSCVADVSEVSRTPDISPNSAINTMFALIYQMQAAEEAAERAAQTAAATAAHIMRQLPRQQQYQQQQPTVVLPAGTHEPLLLTLLQLLQLVPNMRTAEALLQLMQFVLNSQAQLMRLSLSSEETQSSTVVHRGAHPALLGQVQGLVGPLLQQLGPAVLHALRVNSRAVAAGEEEGDELEDVLIPNFWAGNNNWLCELLQSQHVLDVMIPAMKSDSSGNRRV